MKLARGQELLRGVSAILHLGDDAVVAGARAVSVPVYGADFLPPAGGDPERIRMLSLLCSSPVAEVINTANAVALGRLLAADPWLVGVAAAHTVVPDLQRDVVLHAGPPLAWDEAIEPLRSTIAACIVQEGLATQVEAARSLAANNTVRLAPGSAHAVVLPAATAAGFSTPMWIIEDRATHPVRRAFAPVIGGAPRSVRYGATDDAALAQQRRINAEVAPALALALQNGGPLALKPLLATAITMGDEAHRRTRALAALVFRALAPALVRATGSDAPAILDTLALDDDLLATVVLPAAHLMLTAAEDVPCSSLVTRLARNGSAFGLQLSALPGRWFTGPAFPAHENHELGATFPSIGDSTLIETIGLGGCTPAPADAGANAADPTLTLASVLTETARICVGSHRDWISPMTNAGISVGIDLRRVVEHNVLPTLTTSIVGINGERLGVGSSQPPWECFYAALPAFCEHVRSRLGL